ncbi:isoprenoid biosynthesis-like protein [Pleurotus eryngii]|uniref:Isoprenoid biosynthesis-like protein n=1 Tax=Pleurotus eryngii TaxID=5323 RepID=A0A9P5ZWR0_PLEER|nr:isoprenoid biosynthesis-like protein [Pleurotus eryngii]
MLLKRRDRFLSAWEPIRDELVQHMEQQQLPKDACNWYRNNLDYNVIGGKLNRGMSVIDSAEILLGRSLTNAEYGKAAVLGWCIELFQAFCLVSDDVMDKCHVRRTQPCWYRLPHVRLIAVNDACMLRSAISHLLKKHFRRDTMLMCLNSFTTYVSFNTDMGQLVDLITASEDTINLSKFSLERHRKIVVYKTAYYSFYLPVALAMRLTGILDSDPGTAIRPYQVALSILIPLGEYFQVQDDWLDYAGTVEEIGKVGTDIIDNKCSWCVNTALSLANPEQRAILDANYGGKRRGQEWRVKKVFEEVGIAEEYAKYEDNAFRRITGLIEIIPEVTKVGELKREVFVTFLQKIHKRLM